jgi:protein-S-isoprenylcysteine O-methyltransferase Ste14
MNMSRFFDWFAFGVLVCLACLALPRMARLYARGVRVLVVDRQRTVRQILQDLVAMTCLLVWSYELVAYAWLLEFHPVPACAAAVLFDWPGLKIAGALLTIAGVVIYGLGTRGLGESWRLGIDRKTPGPLARDGIFTWTRNPIYLSFDLLFIGTFLVHGRLHFLLLASVMSAILHLLILREERFLSELYGDAFGSYCARVGRYVTWRQAKNRE